MSPGGDDRQYAEIALNISGGKGYALRGQATAYRAPLYPLFLAGVRGLAGTSSPGPVRVAQAFWSALGLRAAYQVAFMAGGPTAAAAALALCAFDPVQILLPTSLYLECFYSVLLLIAAWAAAEDRFARFGLALGLTLTCRSTLALAPAAFLPRRGARKAAVFLSAVILPLLPWLARNAFVFHRIIPFETGVAGPVLYYASAGRVMAPENEAGEEPLLTMYKTLPHTEWDSFAFHLAMRNIRDRPGRYLRTSLLRAWTLWTDSYACYLLYYHPALSDFMTAGRHWDRMRSACQAAFAAALLLALCGAVLKWNSPGVRAAAGLACYFNVYALGTVFARFNAPLTPLIYVLAGIGAAALIERQRAAKH